MAINLEMPKKLQAVIDKGHQGAAEMIRPISRKYDLKEHAYPVELDTLANLFEGISDAKTISFAGAEAFRDSEASNENRNGGNMSAVLNAMSVRTCDRAGGRPLRVARPSARAACTLSARSTPASRETRARYSRRRR